MVHPRTPTLARIHARAKQQGGGSVSNKSRRLETSFTGPYLSASLSTPIDLHFLASVALTNEVHMAYISSHTCMDSFIHPENVAKKMCWCKHMYNKPHNTLECGSVRTK